jgi:hypothetical protein
MVMLLALVLVWKPLEDLWYVAHTAPIDCARVIDTSPRRRSYRPMCMSLEELARDGYSTDAGMSQDSALLLLIVGVVVALALLVLTCARLLPEVLRRRGLRIPDD